MASLLNDNERQNALTELADWHYDSDKRTISKDFKFKDFIEAWGFMCKVAITAEKLDHHPDWSNGYNKVSVSLTTHDAEGITEKDIKLAKFMDATA